MPFVTSVMALRDLWRRKSGPDSSSSLPSKLADTNPKGTGGEDDDKVIECILQSPLLGICNIQETDVRENILKYTDIASHMIQSMGMPDKFEDMSEPDR